MIRGCTSKQPAPLGWRKISGLAESGGGEGLVIAKELYIRSFERFSEQTAPYRPIIDIDRSKLPNPKSHDRLELDQICQHSTCAVVP